MQQSTITVVLITTRADLTNRQQPIRPSLIVAQSLIKAYRTKLFFQVGLSTNYR